MGIYLVVSIIIRTFVLSVVKSETGSGGITFAEGRLQPAYIKKEIPHLMWGDCIIMVTFYIGHSHRYLLPLHL